MRVTRQQRGISFDLFPIWGRPFPYLGSAFSLFGVGLFPIWGRPFPYLGSAFSLFGVGASSVHYPRSPVLCFFALYSFVRNVFSYITSLHLGCGLPVFRSLPSSMLSLLHILLSFSPHGLTISVRFSSVLTYVCHTCPLSPFLCHDLHYSYYTVNSHCRYRSCVRNSVRTTQFRSGRPQRVV